MNLITDPWIPVYTADSNEIRHIAPWEIAHEDVLTIAWGRADFDIACHEFLIGLIFLACPPVDEKDRQNKQTMTPEKLKAFLEPYAPAFNLIGDGPLFMQENGLSSDIKTLDGLLLNGAGGQTIRNNCDIMVHRNQLERISFSFAAMLLYTLQTYAPSGGAGNRTSLRGGGPMTVLLQVKGGSLRDTIWLNVPFGQPADMSILPWMKDTIMTSEKGQVYDCPDKKGFTAEAFFGMPRRILLIREGDEVIGFSQKPYGINYGLWRHPLSPYYKMKPKDDWIARHPMADFVLSRDAQGLLIEDGLHMHFNDMKKKYKNMKEISLNMKEWWEKKRGADFSEIFVIIAGWSMNNMFPENYIKRRFTLIHMTEKQRIILAGIFEGVQLIRRTFAKSMENIIGGGAYLSGFSNDFAVFFEQHFLDIQEAITEDEDVIEVFFPALKKYANRIIKTAVYGCGLADRPMHKVEKIAIGVRTMGLIFRGYGDTGKLLFSYFRLESQK